MNFVLKMENIISNKTDNVNYIFHYGDSTIKESE